MRAFFCQNIVNDHGIDSVVQMNDAISKTEDRTVAAATNAADLSKMIRVAGTEIRTANAP